MAKSNYAEIAANGLWKNNPVLVQVLGLCPTLAVTASIVNALGLSIATTIILVISNVIISLIRKYISEEIRIPVFIIVIASFVSAVALLIKAYVPALDASLGIFIPLIVTNCVILGRAEAFAFKNSPVASAIDGLATGLGFLVVLCVLGAVRELLGSGTLMAGMDQLLGSWASCLKITVISDYKGFLLAILPPGAFIGLGILLAMKNIFDQKTAK
ncbi:MAG: electron transport complex subunit E [Gammaproteobacteria bacterium]|nr:MAG: electron transport complex subunit E [Gammaproteobacteria bacterium]